MIAKRKENRQQHIVANKQMTHRAMNQKLSKKIKIICLEVPLIVVIVCLHKYVIIMNYRKLVPNFNAVEIMSPLVLNLFLA